MSFAHRVIAITGAASGIGLATAHLLASHSATLSIADINASALSHAETSLRRQHPSVQILSYILDVRSEEQVAKWIETTLVAFGRLDGAANLAGVIGKSIGLKGVRDLDMDEWDFVLGVNLRGVALCLKYQLRAMAKEVGGKGSVVNASSVAGVMGMVSRSFIFLLAWRVG
ncbi:hypothetical protein FB567DRAFT_232808 [Paraphoma chrysanthemicola]|uniref:NAD(P)-binding protein n=1 Tax=Paraphoma chrysanthemicola TaxID=798071 RepID=A0A8K0W370_9PLEO|nr:hypothetical protein FB567DRAFT_232808 [Paraphoma chrysanthemicola]